MKEKKPFQFKLETDPLMHFFSICSSVVFSYFYFPGNLDSPGTLFALLISNFISVNIVSNVMRYFKGD
jgi:hypothetical protein